jgi:deoxyribonuclease-4
MSISIGCHVSASGGVWNAPKNAFDLGCETFQIFTRPPMGGPAPKLDDEVVERFKGEMEKYYPEFNSPPKVGGDTGVVFVVHCPYFINFGSAKKSTYHGSISVVSEELTRANLLGAKYVMTHLGSFKDLGQVVGMKQAQAGLKSVLEKYEGKTQFLLEIAAGSGEIIGDTFEELAELMEPLVKFKTFGGICFDTQHAFSSGYDLRNASSVAQTFKEFDKAIGLKWLKMSHVNDSKVDFGGKKDRHEHIGEGKIGEKGFKAILEYFNTLSVPHKRDISPKKGEKNNVLRSMPLILETEHDKVKTDLKILKQLRDKTLK